MLFQGGGDDVAQQVKVAAPKPDCLSSIPRTQMVEENRLLPASCPPHTQHDIHTHTCISTQLNKGSIFFFKEWLKEVLQAKGI